MMNNYFKSSVKLLALLALIPCFITENFASERKVSMNENWKFYRGCIANAEQTSFKDTQWRELDLPHDWSMDPVPIQREGITIGPFSRMSVGGADRKSTRLNSSH